MNSRETSAYIKYKDLADGLKFFKVKGRLQVDHASVMRFYDGLAYLDDCEPIEPSSEVSTTTDCLTRLWDLSPKLYLMVLRRIKSTLMDVEVPEFNPKWIIPARGFINKPHLACWLAQFSESEALTLLNKSQLSDRFYLDRLLGALWSHDGDKYRAKRALQKVLGCLVPSGKFAELKKRYSLYVATQVMKSWGIQISDNLENIAKVGQIKALLVAKAAHVHNFLGFYVQNQLNKDHQDYSEAEALLGINEDTVLDDGGMFADVLRLICPGCMAVRGTRLTKEDVLIYLDDRPTLLAAYRRVTGPDRPDFHAYFLNICDAVAARATCRLAKVGAVLVDKEGHIVATGFNGTHPGSSECHDNCQLNVARSNGDRFSMCPTVHAEINAISQYINRGGKLSDGCTLYVNYPPCTACVQTLINFKLPKVVYKGDNGYTGSHAAYADLIELVRK